MIVNLSCPSCGKQATEYDKNKWSCLYCGIKFLYEPAVAPVMHHTVHSNSSVTIAGTAPYDLDVGGAKEAKPIRTTAGQHTPQAFENPNGPGYLFIESEEKERAQAKDTGRNFTIAFIGCVLVSVMCLLFGHWLLMLLPVVPAFIFFAVASNADDVVKRTEKRIKEEKERYAEDRRIWREAEERLEKLRNEVIVVGRQPVCPYCGKDTDAAGVLSHCLHCGRQFHFYDNKSYPVRFR